MKLSTSLVAVKKIKSNVPHSDFPDDELNKVAELILKAEGIINPIVVRRTSLESYEVVDGDFEYYAAARAREIDPRKGEMIGAFIIEPENEEAIADQVKALRKRGNETDKTKQSKGLINEFEKYFNEIKATTKKFEEVLSKQPEDIPGEVDRTAKKLDYEPMTVKQLQAIAKDRGIKGYSKLTKPKLIAAIKKADISPS